jgi:xanthine dehydrogenase YagS FAD-binding subunit
MKAFGYSNPTTLNGALAALGGSFDEAQVLAGGTDLISSMKDLLTSPQRVVNIKNIAELGGIARTAAGVRIGATVTLDELASNAVIRAEFPALREAALGVTSPQIRNMGTVGGDLCQRPRCWYFRNGFGLLAMKDGRSLVPEGQNRYHAIFGGGPAYFVSASSFGPALVALNAKFKLVSASGARTVDAAQFFLSPRAEGQREVDLKPGEILTEVVIPAARTKNATYEIRQREVLDWPLAAASVALAMEGGRIKSAKVVLGHVAPTPWVAEKAGAALAGKTLSEAVAAAAGEAAAEGAQPLSQNGYKVQLVKVAVKRALLSIKA